MIPTYDRVLNAIEKALQELVGEYQGVRKSLQDLVEGQERNTAQLERIGTVMEQRWGSEGEVRNVKIIDGGLHFLFFIFTLFFFSFSFILFSIFRTTWVRVYQSCCYKLMAKSQD